MKLAGAHTVLFVMLLGTPAAHAQLSVTTIGATEASACFTNAADQFSEDTQPCDEALDDRTTTRTDRKKTLVNRGVIYNRRGDFNEALADFNAAIEIDDDIAEAYLNRGNTWFYASRYDDALADYEKALDLDVAKPWAAWYNIGLVHDAREETEKAQEAYRKSLSLKPDFALAQRKVVTAD
jgi:tetratricopeptide (TPR) repeat protein